MKVLLWEVNTHILLNEKATPLKDTYLKALQDITYVLVQVVTFMVCLVYLIDYIVWTEYV